MNSSIFSRRLLRSLTCMMLVFLITAFPAGRPVFAICTPAATSGNNVITCDGANDIIDALAGNDQVNGGAGNDSITGGAGNDTLTGGAGDDTLIGGAGNDAYAFDTDTSLGTDTVTEASGGGTDTLNFTGSSNALTVNLGTTGNQVVNSNLTLNLTAEQVENITGGSANDVLVGNSLNNTINGGNGNNTITGAGGNDSLTGGTGSDVFVFDTDASLGRDVVNGGAGVDGLDFSSSSTAVTVNLATTASDQTVNSNLILRLSNVENVTGGTGDDTLTGSTAANVFIGGDGNDVFNGGTGNDTLNGGAGNDRVVQTVNANQTLSNTLLTGTGNDTLVNIEDAWLTGGAGNNTFTVTGWTGTATINGAGGTDVIVSSNDADFVLTSTQLTRSTGGVFTLSNIERATLTGGNGDNLLDASAFTAGNVTLSGGNGNDVLSGGSGADSLTGGSGNDSLTGGAGNDTLAGSAGNDTYLFSGNTLGTDTLNEAANADSDTLDFSSFTPGVTLNLASTASQTVNAGDLILRLQTTTSIENVIGSSGADTITGNTRDNVFTGGDGNDVLTGGTGNDTYNFDADGMLGSDTVTEASGGGTDALDFTGSDGSVSLDLGITTSQIVNSNLNLTLASTQIENLTGGNGNDSLTGNSLDNLLSGGDGDDTLLGLGGIDTLNGGNGNDLLDGGSGNDSLSGGNGDDTYDFDTDSSLGADTISDLVGGGTDTLDFGDSASAVTVDLGNSLSQVVNGNLTLTLGTSEIETVIGGGGDDTLTGNSQDNTLSAGSGDDTLAGGDGNDILNGGDGNDSLNGGNNDDVLYGSSGDDLLDGGPGTNSIFGGDGNDTFTTGDGVDAFDGGADDDLIYIAGTHVTGDIIDGGFGSNLFVFQPGTNGAIELISSGADTLDFSLFNSAVTIDLSNNSQQNAGGGLFLTLSGYFEIVYGSAFDDTITGNSLDNTLYGGDGNDVLIGDSGADTLYGENGNDTLNGGSGTDLLDGGAGTDTVQSYSSADTHVDIENGFPLAASSSTSSRTRAATSTLIPVTGGIPLLLDCEENPVSLVTENDSRGYFYNLCGYTVVLDEVVLVDGQLNLPGTYVDGLSIVLINEGLALDTFPDGSMVNLSFPISMQPEGALGAYWWDTTASDGSGGWVEVPVVAADGYAILNVNRSGSYILVLE